MCCLPIVAQWESGDVEVCQREGLCRAVAVSFADRCLLGLLLNCAGLLFTWACG